MKFLMSPFVKVGVALALLVGVAQTSLPNTIKIAAIFDEDQVC